MAALTIQTVGEAGLNATYAAAAGGGDTALNEQGDMILHAKNGDASPHTVTVTAQVSSSTVPGLGPVTKANVAVAVPAGEDRFMGPFAKGAFNNAGGSVAITYDAPTSMTIAALRVQPAG